MTVSQTVCSAVPDAIQSNVKILHKPCISFIIFEDCDLAVPRIQRCLGPSMSFAALIQDPHLVTDPCLSLLQVHETLIDVCMAAADILCTL